jgi:hypothetical protein
MSPRPYLLLSGSIFTLVAALHIWRAASTLPFQLGAVAFPLWVSWVGGVAAAGLAIWAFRLARR